MKLLFLNYEFPPLGGGAGKASAAVAREMARMGHEVRVVTSHFGSLSRREDIDGYTVIRIKTLRRMVDRSNPRELLAFLFLSIPRALRETRTFRPDFVVAFFGIPSGPAAYLARLFYHVPYVVSMRGLDVPGYRVAPKYSLYYRALTRLIRHIWKKAAVLIANSYGLRTLAHETAPAADIHVIPNGVELAHFPPGQPTPSDDLPHLLFVGRLISQKGLNYLLDALPLIETPYRLTIVGDGSERMELEAQAAALNVAEHIRFTGWQEHSDISQYYREADIFVLPSQREGLPNVLLEAMACGLPIVATRVSGNEDLIEEGRNGFLVSPRNPAALAQKLEILLGNPALRRQMGAASEQVAQNYSWQSCAERYLDLMQEHLDAG